MQSSHESLLFQQFIELLKQHAVIPTNTHIDTIFKLFNDILDLITANAKPKLPPKAKASNPHHPISDDATATEDENSRLMTMYHAHEKQKRIEWRSKMPQLDISEETWDEIYAKIISHHQGSMQGNGAFFETYIEELLQSNSIPFKRQVTIDVNGIVIGFGIKNKCNHILDIVVGTDIEIGKHISNFCVISLKTTARERWSQDQEWSLKHPPNLFIFLTMKDPPPAERFQESDTRKIMTCFPKKKDDRKYKLSLNDLISLLR